MQLKMAGDRYIQPGDFVVNEKYGVGKYIETKHIDITPAQKVTTLVPGVLVQYKDGFITWFEKFVENDLWLYRTAEAGEQELSSLLDNRKWEKKKRAVERRSKKAALDLFKLISARNKIHRDACSPDGEAYRSFEAAFPFTPTSDQLKCFQAVEHDMVRTTRPMDRLICGDVGFGKTEVAMRAIYRAVQSGKQVALLSPTRVLAKQHERTLKARMPDVNVQLLRGGGRDGAKMVKENLKQGTCQVVIGTHALLQPSVHFRRLGLVVVDEEQRFGVQHKEWLRNTTAGVDVLTLSATPIPRTLQMSLSGLKDISVMQSPPEGRKPVQVYVTAETSRRSADKKDESSDRHNLGANNTSPQQAGGVQYPSDPAQIMSEKVENTQSTDGLIKKAIESELRRGGQVFVVVPFIRDVLDTKDRIRQLTPHIRVLEAHGEHADLEQRVESFLNKEADVLVATTIIENGIDMSNVNTIIVLSAERFGMSALYQLKGRVGRSAQQAHAYFITSSAHMSVEAESRLNYLKTFTALGSGYDLSRRDMEMRGHGTLFGAEQSGAQDIGLDLEAKMLAEALEIAAISGLEQLVSLKRLDLSFNKIRKIENLQELHCLEFLDLRANSISSVNDLDELRTALFLQGSDGEDSNPACKHPSYITIVIRSLPQLQIIDGGHLNITEAFTSLEDHLRLLQPDPADSVTPPLQPWLDGLLLNMSTGGTGASNAGPEYLVPTTEEEFEVVLASNKRFQEVSSAHQQIEEMLSEECSHLLRKAQTAVNKAGSTK